MAIIDQFTSGGRLFLAKQGMELLLRIGPRAPFEKVELACLIYDRMVNKNSVQLLINTFKDQQERDNLIHRLKLDQPQDNNNNNHQNALSTSPLRQLSKGNSMGQSTGKITVVNDCMILPEKPREDS
jgi:hypothetical protein